MSVKIIVTVCLIVAVVFFIWYFITSREKFASDEIHYYSSLHNQNNKKNNKNNKKNRKNNKKNRKHNKKNRKNNKKNNKKLKEHL